MKLLFVIQLALLTFCNAQVIEDFSNSDYFYELDFTGFGGTVWTAPVAHKPMRMEAVPTGPTQNSITIYAAGREYEPFQIVIAPQAGTVNIDITDFAGITGGTIEIFSAVFGSDDYADELVAESGTTLTSYSLSSTDNTVLWFDVYVPAGSSPGTHTATLTIGGSSINVDLYVFDFDIPLAATFKTQMNVQMSQPEETLKDILFSHRHTPKSVPWPSGFSYTITWDNNANPVAGDICTVINTESYEPDQFSIGYLGPRYVKGEGWNGVGFSSNMLFQFVSNSQERPSTFCGISLGGDAYGTSAYNTEYTDFLKALQDYLDANGMLEKSYYYVQNEPQNEADEDVAAYLCDLFKTHAPNLKLAVSEEPKPSIAENDDYPCGYDIWIAHVAAYQREYAWSRVSNHDEEVWLYSLEQDAVPLFNPTRTDNSGMNARIIPWISWMERVTGYAYYAVSTPSNGGWWYGSRNPGIRAKLFREGFEDYEYLVLANGGIQPSVHGSGCFEDADYIADSIAKSPTVWRDEPAGVQFLKKEMGLYIEGSRTTIPILGVDSDNTPIHPRGSYYLSFQDPTGNPTGATSQNGNDYTKYGWDLYSDVAGFGWAGGNPQPLYGYSSEAGTWTEVERGFVYDDFGREALFEFEIENGEYTVTSGIGWPGKIYAGNPHNLKYEGTYVVRDWVAPSLAETVLIHSSVVSISDGRLSISISGDTAGGDPAYTFLSFVDIEPYDQGSTSAPESCDPGEDGVDDGNDGNDGSDGNDGGDNDGDDNDGDNDGDENGSASTIFHWNHAL